MLSKRLLDRYLQTVKLLFLFIVKDNRDLRISCDCFVYDFIMIYYLILDLK